MLQEPLFTSRREFLAGSFTFLSVATTLPGFLGTTARALAGPEPKKGRRGDSDKILVVVQLAGGNDGLNTVVPYEMDAYYKARPQIAIPKKDVLKLEKGVGLHPAAAGLKELFDEGRMAIVQGVGYPNPDRSHFTSTDIWQTADPTSKAHEGWLGRYFDSCCNGADPGIEPISGIALTKELPLALQGEKFMPLSFEDPQSLTWQGGKKDDLAAATFRKLNNIDGDYPKTGHELAIYLQRAALEAQVGADEIRNASGKAMKSRRGGGRGGDLARSLELVASMIAADLPTRIYYVSMGGFDTHTGQQGRQQQLLSQLGNALKDFVDTLEENKQLDRVVIMSFSEFGRRVQENASGGTDHGEAAPMFLFGSQIKPGVHEKHPSLENLHRGDLAFGCDFRRVYSSVLQNWLDTKPDKVLGKGFAPLNVIKA